MTVKVEKKRIVTAVALVVFTAAVIFLGGWVTIVAAYLAMILVTMDAVRAIKKAGIRPMELIDYLICAAILPAYLLAHLTGVCLVLAIGVIITLCAAVFTKVRSFYDVVFTLFLFMYPILPAAMLLFIAATEDQTMMRISVIMTCVFPSVCDLFAYFVGMAFGKRKLCPEISPKKTVEGSVGAFIGGLIAGMITGFVVTRCITDVIPFYHYLIIGFASGFFSQVGDLSASLLKRFCGVKDYGSYLPGHGGLLDRMDSIVVTAVLMFLYTGVILS